MKNKGKRKFCTIEEKIEAIAYSQQTNDSEAAKRYNICRSSINYWKTKVDKIEQLVDKGKAKKIQTGKQSDYKKVKEPLYQWIIDCISKRKPLTTINYFSNLNSIF